MEQKENVTSAPKFYINPKKTGGGCPTPPQSFIVRHFKLVQGNVLIFGDFSVQAF